MSNIVKVNNMSEENLTGPQIKPHKMQCWYCKRFAQREIKEVIIALNSTLEGEATSYFLLENLKEMNIKVTKLAEGVPAGGDLDYVDNNTLKRAFSWRRELGD